MTCRLFPELQSAYRCNVFRQHFKDKFGFWGTALEFKHVVIDSAASVKFDISTEGSCLQFNRIDFKIIFITYKAIHGTASEYITEADPGEGLRGLQPPL